MTKFSTHADVAARNEAADRGFGNSEHRGGFLYFAAQAVWLWHVCVHEKRLSYNYCMQSTKKMQKVFKTHFRGLPIVLRLCLQG